MTDDRDKPNSAPAELPSHRLAFRDVEFLERAELRSYRLALEYLKPQLHQRELGVVSTIVVFGSARIPAPDDGEVMLREALQAVEERPDDPGAASALARARRLCEMVDYYEQARRFAGLVSEYNQGHAPYEFVITTGGGPGIMEAANRGASERGLKTMGFNIEIPHEQDPNPWITPELCFNFHYFAIRKMHLLLKARALVIFPGGFGTMDELFETLTLIQTRKIPRIPIVMFGERYWSQVFNLQAMADAGTIDPGDLELIDTVETAEEAWECIHSFWSANEAVATDE